MHAFLPKLVAFFSIAFLFLTASPTEAGNQKFAAHGFEISVPKGWTEIPLSSDEQWVVARHKSPKADRFRDKDRGGTRTFEPRLTVIMFLDQVVDAEAEVSTDEGDVQITFESPFEDYIDFMKKTSSGFSREDEGVLEHNGLDVEWFEIQHTGSGVNIKVYTWVYRTELGKVAVQYQCFEDSWSKRKREAMKILKSLKTIEITEDLDLESSMSLSVGSLFSFSLDADERKSKRQDFEEKAWTDAQSNLTDGWTAKKIKDVPVLTVDMGYAKKVVSRILGVRAWCEANFSIIGEGEYVRLPIVRVFEDGQSESDYNRSFFSNEITTNKRGNSSVGRMSTGRTMIYATELGFVNYSAMSGWFSDRDRDVFQTMPAWLRVGLSQLVAQAEPKGKRMNFPKGAAERFFVREVEEDDITPVQELMRMSYTEFSGDDTVARIGESLALVRYFLDGAGSKGKLTKNVLPTYLQHLSDLAKESRVAREEEFSEDNTKEAETEEEEEEIERQRREWFEAQGKHIRDEAFARTFDGWNDSSWNAVERAYKNSF
ncbi:MAG: hypothetical protein ACI8TQ_001160 [Planctomycetota bacterium]|jgi:hypothetical protein